MCLTKLISNNISQIYFSRVIGNLYKKILDYYRIIIWDK